MVKDILGGKKMSKRQRRERHEEINAHSKEYVRSLVRAEFPDVKGAKLDDLCKEIVGMAHEVISPVVR